MHLSTDSCPDAVSCKASTLHAVSYLVHLSVVSDALLLLTGKTTLLRDVTRMLADKFHKLVMVVDTSEEIAGGGNIPHACIGSARRMLGSSRQSKHEVMQEAVANHGPEVCPGSLTHHLRSAIHTFHDSIAQAQSWTLVIPTSSRGTHKLLLCIHVQHKSSASWHGDDKLHDDDDRLATFVIRLCCLAAVSTCSRL